MKQFSTALAAALFVAIASMSFSLQANAASHLDYSTLKSSAQSSSPLLQQAYYERRSHYDEEDYEDEDYYEEEEEEDDYRPRKHYKRKHYKRRHYEPRESCHTEYVSKYVCKQPVPRCLKQRECVWHYGEEYCRYVRKCTRTEKKCHYVKVPRRKCW